MKTDPILKLYEIQKELKELSGTNKVVVDVRIEQSPNENFNELAKRIEDKDARFSDVGNQYIISNNTLGVGDCDAPKIMVTSEVHTVKKEIYDKDGNLIVEKHS